MPRKAFKSPRPNPPPPPRRTAELQIAIAAAALLAVAVVALAVSLLGGDDEQGEAVDRSLGGIVLPDSVAYVMDTGTASERLFRPAMLLLIDSARTLPPGGRYQFVFWPANQLGRDALSASAFPARTLRPATAASLDSVRDRLDEIDVGGSTEAVPALRVAFDARPAAIVLVTGNAAFLPRTFAQDVLDARKASLPDVVIHTITLGQEMPADGMFEVADETGGKAISLTVPEIRQLRRQLTARPGGS